MNKLMRTIVPMLALAVLLLALPLTASAASSGTCGDNLTWTLDDEGVLTISGTGEMNNAPWGKSVVRVIISEGVTSIREYAFMNCTSLTSVTIPESVTSIGKHAFYNCPATIYAQMGSATIQALVNEKFSDPDYPDLILTASMSSEGVISYSVVGCNPEVVSVTIPDGVTAINYPAFRNCTALTSITIPDSVASISYSVFSGCTSLTDITLPDDVTSIDGDAFDNCSATIYAQMGSTTCQTLADAVWKGMNFVDSDYPDMVLRAFKNSEGMVFYSVADCNPEVVSVTIPEGVTSIDLSAFEDCTALTSIVIPEGVTAIGSSAFKDCTALTSIVIPEGVTSIGATAFYNCSALISVVIPESVTVIADYCFESCTVLSSVTLPESLTTINREAFRDCASLSSITLPDNMTSINSHAFYNSPTIAYAQLGTPTADALAASGVKFTDPDYPDLILKGSKNAAGEISYAVVGCNPEAVSVTIPDVVTKIDRYAFQDCSKLSSVTFPDGLTSIDYGAFTNCTSLTSVTLPDNIISFGSSYSSTPIFDASTVIYANMDSATAVAVSKSTTYTTPEAPELSLKTFVSSDGVRTTHVTACKKGVTKVVIPEGVTEIDQYAFQNCTSLTSVSLPDTLTRFGTQAFYKCTALTSVTIPGSLTSVGSWAFADCTSLTSVTIEEGVTGIEYNAFGGCTSLNTVNLPKSMTTIGEKAFQDCTSLTSVNFSEGLTTIGVDAFNDCDNLTVVELPEGLTTIGDSAFYHCSNLIRVSLPDSLTTIGDYAFQNCIRLSSINFPDGLTKIGQWSFASCHGLTDITIPGGVETIESCTFHATENLTTVTIEDGVKNINFSAFEFSYVDEVYIPNSVAYINTEAFFGCNMTIYCYENSYAHSWAEQNNYKYVLLDGKSSSDYVTVSLPENTIVSMGIPVRLNADIFPVKEGQKVTWKSSSTAVAKVSSDGVVTPVKSGTATITLTVDGASATGKVTVAPAITELSLPETVYVIAKNPTQLPLTLAPANAAQNFMYTIADKTYASIDENGLVTANAVGTTTITVIEQVSGRILRANLCITYPVSAVSFASSTVNVPVNGSVQLTANVTMNTDSCVNQLVTFTSSDEKVAKVDQNGRVTGVAQGTATITATAENGVSASCKVTIIKMSAPTLPAGMEAVEDESFMGTAVEYVVLPEACTTIGSRAFAQCTRLTTIYMPDSVKSIADDAFEGSGKVVFVCESKNYAYEYALRNSIECQIQ